MAQYAKKQGRKRISRRPMVRPQEHDELSMSPNNVIHLQQSIGNQATMRMMTTPVARPTIQRGVQELIEQHKKAQEDASKSKTSTATPRASSGLGDKQSKYFTALAKHKKDRAALLKHVERGAELGRDQKIGRGKMSADAQKRLANSCEWILAGKTKLYALTATGDSSERVTAAGKNPAKKVAYFPAGVDGSGTGAVTSSIAPYNYKSLTDNANIEIDDNNTVGWNGEGYLAVTNPQSRTQEYIWETIRHEVQHDADQNRDKEDAAPTDWQEKLEGYKTEYRAYSYEGSAYDDLDHDPSNLVTEYGYQWTARQLAIFKGVFEEYDHTSDGWGKTRSGNPASKSATERIRSNSRKARKLAFQQAIVAYRNPDAEGFNKWNSVRVDDFYKALKEIPDGTDVGNPSNFVTPLPALETKVQGLVDVLGRLNLDDAQYILNDSPDFTSLLGTKLQNQTLAGIRTLLGNVT